MADIFLNNHYRRWNKCFIYRDFKCTRWIYSMFICCLYLHCALSACSGYNTTVSTYPVGHLKVPYGQPLEILCTTEGNYTSENLQFTKNGTLLSAQTTVINDTTIRLYIAQPEKQSITYYCTNSVTKKHCLNHVLVDEKPPNVTDFKCRSKNLESLKCSWSYPKTFTAITYNVSFYVNKRSVKEVTANRSDNNKVSCEWTLSTEPQYRQQLKIYDISLVASNIFGVTKQNFTFNHFAVVVPDKPQHLTVVSTGPHSAVLKWSISNSIRSFLRPCLIHKIEYQVAKSKNFYKVDTSAINSNKNNHTCKNNYTFNLTDLPYAYMRYEVRVYVKSLLAEDKEEFWSYSFVFFETKSEKPSRPPDTAVGAFMEGILNSKREIYVYWKQLEEYERNGPNFTYRAIVTQDDKTELYTPLKDKSMSYIDIKNASVSAIQIRLKSVNSEGSSENSSYLYIPSEDNILEGPASFTKLAYENGTYALYWTLKNIENIENYTLFWCEYNVSRSCVGRMDFTYLNSAKTSHVIDFLPKESKYQFAISANNGMKSSGMHWAKCDISHDIIAMFAFPVTLSHDKIGKNYVTLSWTMACSLQNNVIVAYNISYCPVVDKFFCDDKVQNKSVLVSQELNEVNITGLRPYTTYRFTFALNTTQGLKEVQNATDLVTTSQDAPEKPVNVTITDVTSNSLNISWDPPEVWNGIIQKYVIFNYNIEIANMKIDDLTKIEKKKRKYILLRNLHAFTNYSLRVQACNSDTLCSKLDDSDAVFVRTCIGPPSKLNAPETNSTKGLLFWEPPKLHAGTVDLYQIKRVKDDNSVEIYNATKLSFYFIFCEGVDEHESYQVRAINFDDDLYHGALSGSSAVILTPRSENYRIEHLGPWSPPLLWGCKKSGIEMIFMFMGLLLVGIGMVYGSLKLYRRYKRMEDIKPELPKGLVIPEKEINKYGFGDWNPNKDDKSASSDEVLLLPNKTVTVPSSDTKQDSICTPAHTDSTGLSETSKEPLERQPSTSDENCDSSLGSDTAIRHHEHDNQDKDSSFDTYENEGEAPYTSLPTFNKLPNSGYVQHTIPDTKNEYVKSAPIVHEPLQAPGLPNTSSYVMAGLSPPPIFTTGGPINSGLRSGLPSGYVRPENARSHSFMNFPRLGPSPTKATSPESLPTLPMTPVFKPVTDNIQLESLSGPKVDLEISSLQQKPSSGYVSPGDALLHKHLSIVTGAVGTGPGAGPVPLPESTLSPDAYCRFSWSKDPTTDNLHSWLAEAPSFDKPDLTEMHS